MGDIFCTNGHSHGQNKVRNTRKSATTASKEMKGTLQDSEQILHSCHCKADDGSFLEHVHFNRNVRTRLACESAAKRLEEVCENELKIANVQRTQ